MSEWATQMGKLRSTIMNSAKTKRMNGTDLDGLALVNLAFAYTQVCVCVCAFVCVCVCVRVFVFFFYDT
jgi:hypothetical protein